jgi:hypothetical protein
LNVVIKEPLLGPLHNHTLYHIPQNRSGVILAYILPRFARLPISNAGSPRVRGTMQTTFVMKSNINCLWSRFDVTLPDSLGITVH